ncbi:TolC family protein [Bdellovibrio sp.]|uniref:TolC family protein n=1 Tax=Bdellovibrio sp. TaxID=28201 RepID=UPI0039E48276
MSFYIKSLPLVLSALLGAKAWGKGICENVVSYNDVVSCAEQMSPDIATAKAESQVRKASIDASTQILNPELSLQSVSGTLQSERRTETDLALAFPIEIGGKRSARKQVAEAEFGRSGAELEIKKSEVRKATILNLNRLRQILEEADLVDESRETFAKLVKQYEDRPALSPEQQISLTVFKAAKSDYNFRKVEFQEELNTLSSFFIVTTGLSLEQVKKALPPRIKKWPVLSSTTEDVKSSPFAAISEANVQIAQGELNKAKGEAWPTLMLGPSAKFTKESSGDMQQWGVNLSMPLPVFNVNGGAKAAAAANVQSTQLKRDQALMQISQRRTVLQNFYKIAVDALVENPNRHELEQRHRKIESQFIKGLVSSALVIEAHRSLVDFEKIRNEHEIRALDAYLELQAIDGKKVEINL